jgi:hypothetical protein
MYPHTGYSLVSPGRVSQSTDDGVRIATSFLSSSFLSSSIAAELICLRGDHERPYRSFSLSTNS